MPKNCGRKVKSFPVYCITFACLTFGAVMQFYTFQADQIFTGKEMLPTTAVLICNKQGIVYDIIDESDAGDEIQKFKGVITPGFINCHCHLELSHMKGLIPEKTGLIDFVFSVVTQRHFVEEEILQAISIARKRCCKMALSL